MKVVVRRLVTSWRELLIRHSTSKKTGRSEGKRFLFRESRQVFVADGALCGGGDELGCGHRDCRRNFGIKSVVESAKLVFEDSENRSAIDLDGDSFGPRIDVGSFVFGCVRNFAFGRGGGDGPALWRDTCEGVFGTAR